MGTLRFFEEVVSFKIRRTFGFADYISDAGRRQRTAVVILPVFVADQRHELLARRRVREEYSGECRGSRGRTLLFDAPHLHTHMAGFDHDGDAHRVEGFLDAVADLHRQAFLHLQAAGEALHHAGDFRKARDVSVGDVRHVRFAVEGQHVVLAERV